MNKAIFWDSDGTLLYGNESFAESLVKIKSFGLGRRGLVAKIIS